MEFGKILFFTVFLKSLHFSNEQQSDLPCKQPGPICPDFICQLKNSRQNNFCKDIVCEGVTAQDCQSGTEFVSGLTMCGCCPGCAKYLPEGAPCEVHPTDPMESVNCTDSNPFCYIAINKCKAPEFECRYLGESSKVCAPVPIEDQPDKDLDSMTCEEKRNLGLSKQLYYTAECEDDGSYSPKQCKGHLDDGICFCVDPKGNRIFGREWRSKSQNQTCLCSRQVHALRCKGHIAAIHCSQDGNFEPLQCDLESGLCYCVEPETGKLTGAVLPEHKWKDLPCYSLNVTGGDPTGTYLRVCESEMVAGLQISKEAKLHGIKDVLSVADLNCDYDGAFGLIRRIKGTNYCSDRMGGVDNEFHQEIDLSPMDCQCWRDKLFHLEQGRHFSKTCHNPTGSYEAISVIQHTEKNETYSCVDRDGIFFGDEVESAYTCCLLGTCGSNTPNFCDSHGQRRKCSFWLHDSVITPPGCVYDE